MCKFRHALQLPRQFYQVRPSDHGLSVNGSQVTVPTYFVLFAFAAQDTQDNHIASDTDGKHLFVPSVTVAFTDMSTAPGPSAQQGVTITAIAEAAATNSGYALLAARHSTLNCVFTQSWNPSFASSSTYCTGCTHLPGCSA